MNTLPDSAMNAPDLWMTILKSIGMLSVVLAILIAVLFLMKRMFSNQGRYRHNGLIKMLGSYYLTPKERIVLIEALGEKILIGVTSQNISCLARIVCNGEIDLAEDARAGFFKTLLKGMNGKGRYGGKKWEKIEAIVSGQSESKAKDIVQEEMI